MLRFRNEIMIGVFLSILYAVAIQTNNFNLVVLAVTALWMVIFGFIVFKHKDWLLYFYVLVYGLYPRARIMVAIAPIYALDILTGVGLLFLLIQSTEKLSLNPRTRFIRTGIIFMLLASLPSLIRLPLLIDIDVFNIQYLYLVIRHFLSTLLFFVVIAYIHSTKQVNTILVIFYYTFIISAVWAIIQVLPQTESFGTELTKAIGGIFGLADAYTLSPNQIGSTGTYIGRAVAGYNVATAFGGIYATIYPFLTFAFLQKKRPHVIIPPAVGLIIILFGIIVTFSRQALLGMASGFGAAFVVSLFYSGRQTTRLLIVSIVGAALLGIFLAIPNSPLSQLFVQRFSGFVDGSVFESANFDARLDIGTHRFFTAILVDPSILLWGESLYILELQDQGQATDYQYQGFVSNGWLLPILDGGLLYAFAFGLLYVNLGLITFRRYKEIQGDSAQKNLLMGSLAMLTAFFVTNLSDNYWMSAIWAKSLMFFLFGLIVVIINLDERVSTAAASPTLSITWKESKT